MKMLIRPYFQFTRYKYPYNINRQQNFDYLKKVQRAEEKLQDNMKINPIPRRKRRIYDRPRIDNDISDYGAWRLHDSDQWIYKYNQHAMQVKAKIQISPKWLVHAFGVGTIPRAHIRATHREYVFMDNRMDAFLLYEYRNTTNFKPNIQGYDYENQEHLHPNQRKTKRIPPQQFWNSEGLFQFRVNSTSYAQHHRFKAWIQAQIQKKKKMKSYDQYIQQKFGKFLTYNTADQVQRFQPNKPMIYHITPAHFNPPPPKKGKPQEVPAPPKHDPTWRKLDQKYRIVENINTSGKKQQKKQIQVQQKK